MKKTLALLLAVLLVAALFAGCGPTTEDPSTDPGTSVAPPSYVAPDEEDPDVAGDRQNVSLPLTDEIHTFDYWIVCNDSFLEFSGLIDNQVWKEMEHRTNVHIEFYHPPQGSERENFQTMILSEDYPAFIHSVKGYYQGGVDKAISDGVVLALNDIVDEFMPNYRYYVYRNENIFMQAVSDEGNLWGIHHIVDRPQGSWMGLGIRQDWLDKAGLSSPETVAEMETALTAFKDYLNNGSSGALWLQGGGMSFSAGLNGSWNLVSVQWSGSMMNADGKATHTGSNPLLEDYGRTMQDWYQKGLINKDYLGENSWGTPEAKLLNDELGIYDFIFTAVNRYKSVAENPDFNLVPLTTPKLNAGDDYMNDIHIRQTQDWLRPGNSTCITSKCDDVELAARFFDYGWTDAGITLINWGLSEDDVANSFEGAKATYGIDASDENGDGHAEYYLPWLMDTYENITYIQTKYAVHNGPFFTKWSRELGACTELEQSCEGVWGRVNDDWVWPEGVTLTTDEGNEASGIMTTCNGLVGEWLAAVILGDKDPGTYSTELLPQLESSNVARLEALYQQALDRYYQRIDFMN